MMLPNSQPIKADNIKIFSLDGKPVELATSKDVVIWCDPAEEGGDYNPADLEMEFEIKGTHKYQRQLRAFRKSLGIHKPRLPRKYKKRLKQFINGLERVYQTIQK